MILNWQTTWKGISELPIGFFEAADFVFEPLLFQMDFVAFLLPKLASINISRLVSRLFAANRDMFLKLLDVIC